MGHFQKTLKPSIVCILSRVGVQEAAQAFAVVKDPEGIATPESMAEQGECYALTTHQGAAVFSIEFVEGVAWVIAAAGIGQGMADCLWVAEGMARERGCRVAGFQTMRRGLIRKALKQGYQVTGRAGQGFKIEKTL